jgi:hypothetical protein
MPAKLTEAETLQLLKENATSEANAIGKNWGKTLAGWRVSGSV